MLQMSYGVKRNGTHCFQRLPLEIQEAISIDLPTHEFLKLRFASRAMAALFASSVLWKSKFSLSRERGFLNEILPINNKSANIPRKWGEKRKKKKRALTGVFYTTAVNSGLRWKGIATSDPGLDNSYFGGAVSNKSVSIDPF